MPFDPLSIIAYVSTAAGLLGFLCNTVTRLEQFGRDFHGCSHKLRWYNSQTATCMLHLKAWRSVWCDQGTPYPDEDYAYFMGTENFEELKTKLSLIHAEINEIGALLHSKDFDQAEHYPQTPTAEQWERWQARLQQLCNAQRTFHPKASWLHKICFASFRGMNLDERIKRLRDQVSDLKEFSRLACWMAQFRPEVNKDITELELMQMMDRKARLNNITVALKDLYQQCITWGTWSLVLSPPDDEGGPSSMEYSHDVLIEFDVRQIDPRPRDIGIVHFRWSEVRNMPLDKYMAVVESHTDLVIPSWRSQFLRSLLVDPEVCETRSVLARTALGLVNWTLLLWNTPWTDQICTCRIRFVDLNTAGDQWAATLTPSNDATNLVTPCSGCSLEGHKALLLGLSLAELALREIISVTFRSSQPVFLVDNHQLSARQLLQKIDEYSPGFMPAVRYCLYYDAKLESSEFGFRADHIILFKEQVLDLLEIYHRAIQGHEKARIERRQPKRTWPRRTVPIRL